MPKNNVILHVEDDANDVELVEMAFRKAKAGCQLVGVNDGDQAVGYLSGEGAYADRQAHPFPALVLLDLKLPLRSGFEVLEWVRSQSDARIRRLPILMLTSSNQPTDIARAYELGANSYMVKPADLGVLTDLAKAVEAYWITFNVPMGT